MFRCPDCGGRLGGAHVGRRRQVVDLPPPAAVVVTEHRAGKGWCSACRRWHDARLDLRAEVVGQGRLGVGIAALVAHLRTVLRVPIRSSQRYLADLHGLRVSVALLRQDTTQGAAAVTQIRDQARRRPVVHADETGWREAGRNGYAWLLATPEGERYVERHASRAGVVANDLLGDDRTGVLVTDCYGGYNDTPGGRHQRCWVHLLRDLHMLAETHPAHLETQVWVAAVQDVWRRMRTAWHAAQSAHTAAPAATAPPAAAGFLAPLSLADHLQAETRLLGEQFVQDKTHPCHALAWRLWHFQHELLTGLRDPRVPLDNNAAERAIRPLVVARKISGGTHSAQGSQTAMRLYSLAATWQAQGHSPLDEFRRLLQTSFP